jgi:hypothetical protein
MRRMLWTVLLGLALTGCTKQPAPAPAPAPVVSSEEGEQQNMGTMGDVNLYLHDMSPTAGQAKKPTLHLHTESAKQINETTWAFQDADAVIYDKKAKDSENDKLVELWAKEGTFEEGKSANMKGGVKAKMSTMTIELQDIEWQNPDKDKPGEARSDNPVTVTDPQMELQAKSLRIYPDTKEIEFTTVTGTVTFGRQGQ